MSSHITLATRHMGVTVASHLRHMGVTVASQWRHMGVTLASHWLLQRSDAGGRGDRAGRPGGPATNMEDLNRTLPARTQTRGGEHTDT